MFPTALTLAEEKVTGVEMADGRSIPADLVVVAVGVRPRDELPLGAGLPLGPRGGVVIDDACATGDANVWAIGEVANFGGMCLGLTAPANTMVEVCADRMYGGNATFPGFDIATKLKLSGVEVASFSDTFAKTEHSLEVVYADPARGLYQKLVVTGDARTLLGGILVGDASPYTSLRPQRCAGRIDVLTFASAPAVDAVFSTQQAPQSSPRTRRWCPRW